MELIAYIIYFSYTYLISVSGQKCPERPNTLREAEELCYNTHVAYLDRVQQASKSVLNFAKKKLGMDVRDENTPQKCEYYQCVLKQLRMANSTGYPQVQGVTNWIENNVVYKQALKLISHSELCVTALNNCSVTNTYFDGFAASGGIKVIDDTNITESVPKSLQSMCEITTEFVRCLSFENAECPMFLYP